MEEDINKNIVRKLATRNGGGYKQNYCEKN
jgi:hypothetical protein